jgi:uncharacterized protein YcgI (DUF1989 family)
MDGKVLQDAVIAPNDNWSAVLTPRQTLRIVDVEGKQAVDFLCYNADDVADRYNAADTMKYNKNVYLGAGHGIYSVRATKLFTIVADTMGGGHDTIGGCCSAASNMFPLQGAGHAELLRELPSGARSSRNGREGYRRQHQLLHERARAAGRHHGHRGRPLEAG